MARPSDTAYAPRVDDYVTFRTASSKGLSAPLRGVVREVNETSRGPYYGIEQADGTLLYTRASRITPARGRRPASLA